MADNADHYYFYHAPTAALVKAADAARADPYNPTRINTLPEMNGENATTDMVLFDDNYAGWSCTANWISEIGGGGVIGTARCQSLSGAACQRFNLHFDAQYMGPRSDAAERALACHEIGHSVGLRHNGMGGCMLDPVQLETHLGHEIPDHLNRYY
jgi:hypothetical protein